MLSWLLENWLLLSVFRPSLSAKFNFRFSNSFAFLRSFAFVIIKSFLNLETFISLSSLAKADVIRNITKQKNMIFLNILPPNIVSFKSTVNPLFPCWKKIFMI